MTICGLDFGTSNSTIGVLINEEQTMVPLEQDIKGAWKTTLPSALFFDDESDHIAFGRDAVARYTKGEPGRLMRSMKNLLGHSTMNGSTQVKNKFYTYDEIIGFFVESLKLRAEAHIGSEMGALESVVMGRPVHFNDTDSILDSAAEEHLASIAKIAGFKQVSFQFEPIAAALDYEQQVRSEELALIIDIGGGTADFTLIRLSPERQKQADRHDDLLANHGIHIGGNDFDCRLSIEGVMPEFGLGMPMSDRPSMKMPSRYYYDLATWHKIHLLYTHTVKRELQQLRLNVSDKHKMDSLIELLNNRKGHRLASLVEEAKIELSTKLETTVDLKSLFTADWELMSGNCVITQQQLNNVLRSDIEKIFAAVDETLNQAALSSQDITTVFTTGGSTALPMIKDCINNKFPHARLMEGDLYNSVGSGLLMESIKRYR